jgi:uncharacterized protein YacL
VIIVSRIITALILGIVGFQIGQSAKVITTLGDVDRTIKVGTLIAIGVITGLLIGGFIGKWLQHGLTQLGEALRRRTAAELVVGAVGMLIGLLVSFLATLPIRDYAFFGRYMPVPIALIITYVFTDLAVAKHAELLRLLGVKTAPGPGEGARGKLLDTSALIDGRIADVVKAGFLEGEIIVPVFVLEELQRIADSSDDLRRAKGRRGLDVVQKLRKAHLVRTPDDDYADIPAVDSKLVRMAGQKGYAIVTTDFNLNKVARIQQVPVLNVNELANAMKPAFVAGEEFELRVTRSGKEAGQGVGYLEDGTMVVVEGAAEHVGETVSVEVTSVLQNPSGKLVFSRLVDSEVAGRA